MMAPTCDLNVYFLESKTQQNINYIVQVHGKVCSHFPLVKIRSHFALVVFLTTAIVTAKVEIVAILK